MTQNLARNRFRNLKSNKFTHAKLKLRTLQSVEPADSSDICMMSTHKHRYI